MGFIYETKNFLVESAEKPLVFRTEGGHIIISPKTRVADRTLLSPKLAIELMMLSMLCGEAMKTGLANRGIPVGRINYQDNGNWGVFHPEGPFLHLHLFGRSLSARVQKYGEACFFPLPETGFYKDFQALMPEDLEEIQLQISTLNHLEKYFWASWGL